MIVTMATNGCMAAEAASTCAPALPEVDAQHGFKIRPDYSLLIWTVRRLSAALNRAAKGLDLRCPASITRETGQRDAKCGASARGRHTQHRVAGSPVMQCMYRPDAFCKLGDDAEPGCRPTEPGVVGSGNKVSRHRELKATAKRKARDSSNCTLAHQTYRFSIAHDEVRAFRPQRSQGSLSRRYLRLQRTTHCQTLQCSRCNRPHRMQAVPRRVHPPARH